MGRYLGELGESAPGACSVALIRLLSVKSRYPFYGWGPVRVSHRMGVGLSGVDPSGLAAGVGEGPVFTGSVMAGWVGTYEMFPDADLDRVTHDGDLDLVSLVHCFWKRHRLPPVWPVATRTSIGQKVAIGPSCRAENVRGQESQPTLDG